MTSPQALLSALRSDAELTRLLDLHWLTSDEQQAVREEWLGIWDQVPYDEEFHARCWARLARCIPLATGVTRERRLKRTQCQLVLVQDPAEPN